MRQFTLKPEELIATVERINKINKRAEKRGFTGRFDLTAEKVEKTRINDVGFAVTEVFYETKITGEPPSYEGWTFLASLDWDAEAGLIVRTAPGVETVDRTNLKQNWCDHCETTRYRKKSFLIQHEDGRQLQVGSTCIKDFLGWDGKVVFISEQEIGDDIDDHISGGGYFPPSYATDIVLAAGWAIVQVHGYKPVSSWDDAPTKERTMTLLEPPSAEIAREYRDAYGGYFDGSLEQARVVREWALSDEFNGDSEYVRNVKAILAADYVTVRNIGIAVSALQAFIRQKERELKRQQEKAEISNEFVGEVGDRIEVTVTIKSIRYIEGMYGTTTLYTLLGSDGHLYKWFSSNAALGETVNDTVYQIKGTVKKHDEYRGTKSTVLTRCKVQ